MKMEIALFGNPNSGKTSLFNELTGDNRSVGNWTGVTVTLDIGHFHYQKQAFDIVDLPGIYSLFTHSPEQLTACEYLLNYHPDVIVNVVDVTNLERNLYLTTQLVETGVPVVVALNMVDELRQQGLSIDTAELSRQLGVPCIGISATKRIGISKLMDKVVELANDKHICNSMVISSRFSPEIRNKLDEIMHSLPENVVPEHINPRWAAVQMLEEHWPKEGMPEELIGGGDDWEGKIGKERYSIIADIVPRVIKKSPFIKRNEITKKIDAVVCHRFFALPIFVLVMCTIFFLSFGPLGLFIQDLFELVFIDWLPAVTASLFATLGVNAVITGLVVNGIIAGVGAILVFLPQLMLLFLCLAFLENSGYMARAAFLTDKMLASFGLSGMSFIPMVLGFGCSVPAIMTCHALENRRERMLTMMVIPFMSCSARMPVYALLAAAFFVSGQSLVIVSLYFLGILMALCTAFVISPFLMKKERPIFMMEMPPYRKPIWHCVWRTVSMRIWNFISSAGTVILIGSVVIWFLSSFDWHLHVVAGSESILSSIGIVISPVFIPLGFGIWQIAVALISGFISKEAVVSSLAILLAGSGTTVGAALTGLISPAAAYALMVFVLLYPPCIATLAAVRRESSSTLFTAAMIGYQLLVAWLVAFVVYRIGLFFA